MMSTASPWTLPARMDLAAHVRALVLSGAAQPVIVRMPAGDVLAWWCLPVAQPYVWTLGMGGEA